MNNENFNIAPNDENEEFIVEFGEVINDGGAQDYDELYNKPQVNGVTLEGNKTLSELGIPVYRAGNNITISGDNTISAVDTKYTAGNGLKLSGTTFSADTGVLATKTELSSKQDRINDLPAIREGAAAGATAVQPGDLATVATTGSYNDSLDKPSINNVTLTGNKTLDALGIQPKGDYALESEIPDVSNFITNTVDNLVNYYKKSETFTKQEVNDLISAITTMDIQVVQTLPTQDISTTTIYLVPKQTAGTNDAYDEYIYVSNAWEHIGSTEVDLTGYATESWVNTQISNFLTQAQIETLISTALTGYAKTSDLPTKVSDLTNDSGFITGYTETDPTVPSYVKNITQANITSWNNKQNSISDLSTIRSGASAGATAVQPSDLATVATSGSYNDLSNKPDISGKEDKTNKVTSISSSSTDTQYPSAKAVYNIVGNIETLLGGI